MITNMFITTHLMLKNYVNTLLNQIQNKQGQKGYTLSETLMCVAIIGIIAAITVPTVMHDTSDRELKIKWKKTYAMLAQATQKVMYDNEGTMRGFSNSDNEAEISTAYAIHLKVMENCNGTAEHCGFPSTPDGNRPDISYPNTTTDDTGAFSGDLQLTDGTSLMFDYYDGSCSTVPFADSATTYPDLLPPDNPVVAGSSGTPHGACGQIIIDINGFDSPNTWGMDIYQIYIEKDGIKPAGTRGDFYFTNFSTGDCDDATNFGWRCAADHLRD